MSAFDWLAKQAEIRPDKLALVDLATGRRLTYADFHLRASRVAELLRDRWGVRPGDRVAVLAHNSAEVFELLYGCGKIGAILVCLNWRLAHDEQAAVVRDCEPVGLFFGVDFAPAATALSDACGLRRQLCLEAGYEDALAQTSGRPIVMPPVALETPWYLLYTSGTTGTPKGVIQTFGMAFYNAVNLALVNGQGSDDVTLNALPTFHTGGLNLYANPTLHAGGTALVMRAFDPARALSLLSHREEGLRPTMFFAVPAIYLALSQVEGFDGADLSGVRIFGCGGSPVPDALLARYADKGVALCNGFGMTETGPAVFSCSPEDARRRRGSVGKACLHVDVRIVDERGDDVGPGRRGELLVRGPSVTPGYWRQPERTQEAIRHGWLHTGDVAHRDEEGFTFIVDRSKDMFISGGENVYPAEVENVLCALDGVVEAAVVGVPDAKWGEVGLALVVATGVEVDAVIAHCRARLAGYKVPRQVRLVDALPRNASGKLQKHELRARFGA